MPVTSTAAGTPSLTNQARRRQIIQAAIAVIAENGYAGASFARIAEHAQLSSTRLISYHFSGKADLMTAVVSDVLGSIGAHVGDIVSNRETSAGRLSGYIEGVVGFVDSHRVEMIALTEVMFGAGFEEGFRADDAATGHLESILIRGQQLGEFRSFDAAVMAAVVQRSVDGLPFALRADPSMDCGHYARELVTLFELATRVAPAPGVAPARGAGTVAETGTPTGTGTGTAATAAAGR